MPKVLSIVALVVSIAALGLSIVTHTQTDARVEDAIRRREKALVERAKPSFMKIFSDFGMKDVPSDPQTLDDLFDPLIKLMEGLAK